MAGTLEFSKDRSDLFIEVQERIQSIVGGDELPDLEIVKILLLYYGKYIIQNLSEGFVDCRVDNPKRKLYRKANLMKLFIDDYHDLKSQMEYERFNNSFH